MSKKGRFIVVDGLDGVGKGVFLDTFIEEAKKDSKIIFDVNHFWKSHNYHPSIEEVGNSNIIVTSEPTFCGIGKYIREELTAINNRDYSTLAVAEAFALDRRILYEQLLIPILNQGIDVYQSRSISTSLAYQRQSAIDQGKELSIKSIVSIPGNSFCLQHRIDHLVIPTIIDVKEIIKRLDEREKKDNSKFENFDFQLKLKKQYESEEFKNLFLQIGVNLVYLDAGKTIDYSKQQAREFYKKYLK